MTREREREKLWPGSSNTRAGYNSVRGTRSCQTGLWEVDRFQYGTRSCLMTRKLLRPTAQRYPTLGGLVIIQFSVTSTSTIGDFFFSYVARVNVNKISQVSTNLTNYLFFEDL